jgi:GNAT superfamily N-acetyltransferase
VPALLVYIRHGVAEYGAMPDTPLALSRAVAVDAHKLVITRLIQEAAEWLRTKGTDQWANPWPDQAGLEGRILSGLRQGKSWICWDDGIPAATITADPDVDPYWPKAGRAGPAIYVHRLVVSRRYSGTGLGAALLDWAGRTGRQQHGAQWIRVSAWTTNRGLHAYYRQQGFSPCGFVQDDGYPSGARFQKSTASIPPVDSALFKQT